MPNPAHLFQSRLSALIMAAALTTASQAAEIAVQPDSNYFVGWTFTQITSPTAPTPQTIYMTAGQIGTGMLSNRPFNFVVAASPEPNSFGVFPNNYNSFGTNLPANVGQPMPRPGQMFLARGHEVITFKAPLPSGTTFFLQDFDSGEQVDYHFLNCAGNPVDAGNFDFLRISTLNTPTYEIRGTAPARYWHAAASVASDPNTVNGIILRSDKVCAIRIEASRPGNGGSVNYFLGGPAELLYLEPTPVPTLGAATLAALGLLLTAVGLGRRRKSL